MIDWDATVLAPLHAVFAEPVADGSVPADVQYVRAVGGPVSGVTGVFTEAGVPIDGAADPAVNALAPTLGVRLSQFPADYDPRNARGDTFVVRGITYRVRVGVPDSFGSATLEATRA